MATKNDPVEIDTVNDVPATQLGSLLDQLRAEQTEDDKFTGAEPWMPVEAGEGIEGTVVHLGSYLSEGYGDDKVLRTWYVQDETGIVWSVIPFHRELRKLMLMNRAEVGDRVALLFTGDRTSPTDPTITIKGYKVVRVAAARQRRMRDRGDAPRIMTPEAFGTPLS